MSSTASSIPNACSSSTSRPISQIMGPSDVNLMGTVHGGVILRLVDDVAGVVAASDGPADGGSDGR